MRAVLNVDGGSRGNPGPAGAGALIRSKDGNILAEEHEFIGNATNNVAEYRALLLGLDKALEIGIDDIEIVNDSELVARQIRGEYKVKHVDLKPLFYESLAKLERFKSWSIRNVPRDENSDADALANQAIDSGAV